MLGKPSRRLAKQLQTDGTRAPATVLEVGALGPRIESEIHGVHRIETVRKTKLRVEPAGEPAFEVVKRLRYSASRVPVVGATLNVIYDPDDHDKLMIDTSAFDARIDAASALGRTLGDARRHGASTQDLAALAAASLTAQAQAQPQPQPPPPAEEDSIAALSRLADLHDRGVLTDAEFETQKARILGAP